MRLWIWLFAIVSTASFCLADASFSGCEPRPEVRDALRQQLKPADLDQLKFPEKSAREHEVLEGLIAKYPRESEPYKRLIDFVRSSEFDRLSALQDRLKNQAAHNPDDPVALYAAGYALAGIETDESIRLLDASLAKAPSFAWPALELASIYWSGKRQDKPKAAEYLNQFLSDCPASTERAAQGLLLLKGDPDLQKRAARALRERLEKETDRQALLSYETLWGLEFRIRPPQEHPAEREQVRADLKRLESLGVKPDGEWMRFLRTGYKESTESPAALAQLEDRILRDFPASKAAHAVAYDRFKKAHPEPTDHKDVAAWAAYNKVRREVMKGWIRDFTEDTDLTRETWFYEIFNEDSLSEKDGLAALDHFLKSSEYEPPSYGNYQNAAEFLIEHKWQPKRALDLLHKTDPLLELEIKREESDNLSKEEADQSANRSIYYRQEFAGLMLRAARQAGRPAEIQSLRASIDGPPPSQPKRLSAYWLNRARLAVIDNRKADALTYFQLALQTRITPAVFYRGKMDDSLTDEARALWKEMGGTEVAWTAWSKPPTAKAEELKEGRWEKPTKTIPTFEITDLSGKTWKLASLEGKSLLINLWATWCGPCNEELPHLEELYKKLKDRSDIQILTFNVDENLGLVEPFMKEKGFTFPVLPAFSLVNGIYDSGWGIPQNWIVDPQGKWRSTQIGYGAEPDWADQMTQRLEAVRKSETAVPAEIRQ